MQIQAERCLRNLDIRTKRGWSVSSPGHVKQKQRPLDAVSVLNGIELNSRPAKLIVITLAKSRRRRDPGHGVPLFERIGALLF